MIKLRISDLYMASGRKNRDDFEYALQEGPRLYQLIQMNRVKHVLEVRPVPSYIGAFIAGALPEDGRLLSIITNGWNDLTGYVPKPLASRWFIRRGDWKDVTKDIPRGSADMLVIEEERAEWEIRAGPLLRPGAIIERSTRREIPV